MWCTVLFDNFFCYIIDKRNKTKFFLLFCSFLWCKFCTFALFWSEYFEANQSESKRIFWSEYSFSFEANQSESKWIFWCEYSLNEANWKRIRIAFASKQIIKRSEYGTPYQQGVQSRLSGISEENRDRASRDGQTAILIHWSTVRCSVDY